MLKDMKSMNKKGTTRVKIIDPEACDPNASMLLYSSSDLA
jgi:hypothetical protein